MRKLGKKEHEMVETVEAYCNCSACYMTCSCSSYRPLQSSDEQKSQWGANVNVGNGTVYSS
jgi:putative bacteriocin precursor